MTKKELVKIEDYAEFHDIITRCKLPESEKREIIRRRWDYLWQKHKPSEEHIKAKRDYMKGDRQ